MLPFLFFCKSWKNYFFCLLFKKNREKKKLWGLLKFLRKKRVEFASPKRYILSLRCPNSILTTSKKLNLRVALKETWIRKRRRRKNNRYNPPITFFYEIDNLHGRATILLKCFRNADASKGKELETLCGEIFVPTYIRIYSRGVETPRG